MVIWVKKISKIFRTMSVLERHKALQPMITSYFSKLIECLHSGGYKHLMEFPLTTVIESNESLQQPSPRDQSNERKPDR